MPVEALARGGEDRSVGVGEAADRVVVQLVAADAREGGAAVTLVEDADTCVRIAAGVRLAIGVMNDFIDLVAHDAGVT